MPEGGEFLFQTFWEISAFRGNGINGPDPLRPQDIREWAAMTGTILRRVECQILLDCDAAYRAAMADEMADNAKRQEAKRKQDGSR